MIGKDKHGNVYSHRTYLAGSIYSVWLHLESDGGIPRSMPSWSWDDYVAKVRAKGYTLEERRDKKGVLCGYTVGVGDVIYKASELGKGRNLMASKIEAT